MNTWYEGYEWIRTGRKRFHVGVRDAVAHYWIEQLAELRSVAIGVGERPVPLVRFRSEFRTIVSFAIAYDYIGGLALCLTSHLPEARRIAVWLLGRSAHRRAMSLVTAWMHDSDVAMRRTAAHALRRLTAFAELYALERDSDPRVRRIATEPLAARRAYAARLDQYVRHARTRTFPRSLEPHRAATFLRQPIGPGKPPKSRAWIRRLIEHIRSLVLGNGQHHAA